MSNDLPGSGEPEFLSSTDPAGAGERAPRSRRRTGMLIGGLVGLVALGGAGAWAWAAYSGVGAQPSEALPASTLGYASVDLDPSGKQKIEALRILKKFPAFEEEVGLDTDDDLRRRVLEGGLADTDCGLDFEEDFEPWLGMRFAIAAVPGEEDTPAPLLVAQVTDAEAAEASLQKLSECDEDEAGAWEIRGEWALIGEDDAVVQGAADAAAESTLADDESFQRWTDAAGDPGVISMYASPEAGTALASLGGFDFPVGPGDLSATESGSTAMPSAYTEDSGTAESVALSPEPGLPPELERSLAEFEGGALTVRFADGALEVEAAGAATESIRKVASDAGAEVVTTLPADTAAAFGFGLAEGWAEALLDRFSAQLDGDAQDMLDFFASQTGLTLPDDLETLFGESTAFALGSDFDPAALAGSEDGSDVPVGAKVQGDTEAIADILDKIQAAIGEGGDQILGVDTSEDHVATGPNADYRASLLEDGRLGETEAYRDVVRESDAASSVVFVNFDANDWLVRLAEEEADAEGVANAEPLDAAGISTWVDDGDAHVLVRVTTD